MDTSNGANWQTFGHNAVKSILDKQIGVKRFPHAYLFAGPDGVGKKALALEFAQKILGAENLSTHPDFLILDQDGEITMEPVLEFISRLSFKPFLAQKKVAVINNAQNLNLQSANALLKTLEEASESTVIILVANSSRLLPTIVSRCQLLSFYPFSKSQLRDFAAANSLQTTPRIIELSFGSPARLKKLSQDGEFLGNEEQTVHKYESFGKMRLGEKFISIGGLAELEPQELKDNLQTWLMWQNGRLSERPEDFIKARALADCLRGLKQNKNKKLILQGLLLRI